ncbi:MAG TPA: DNA mismatch repair endonuclease MutL [Chitinophagaceae bacterium]|nr:DNA mismatch repair endonuclease MutL [Chitinophagaceae bacterium]
MLYIWRQHVIFNELSDYIENRYFCGKENLLSDIILLLPDHIANQIAAGEVIQRPASAVKELMENSIDAGATEIKLIVNEAGKALIQVVDNGKGMSETDARMSFERHATSKIKKIDDLFHIRTMGFRGEALASIAAVAQVELKTKRADDEAGTCIEIENSLVNKQEMVAVPSGTSIAMKNLFFNVPARRNFLKSNAAELRHIIDEFMRIALAFPQLFFSLTSNGQEVFHLEKGTLKQRIVQLLGNSYNSRLVSVQENTDYLNIYGFVGKPETAKKTRGDQYLFVNNRFIKSAYLNHALMSAYQQMIPADSFPMYVLFIDLDPAQIDVNVHPTKQEIKFEDEKIVYAFVQAAVKHALAQFSITPTLEFDLDAGIQQLEAVSKPFTEENKAAAISSNLYKSFTQKNQAHFIESDKSELRNWKDFYEAPAKGSSADMSHESRRQDLPLYRKDPLRVHENADLLQLMNTYIIAPVDSGYLLIHQQACHERILYERYLRAIDGHPMPAQTSLFPTTLQLSAQDSLLLAELLPDLNQLGYHIQPFGNNAFLVQGTPADTDQGNEKLIIEKLIEQYKHFSNDLKSTRREKLIRSLACHHSVKPGKPLALKEMRLLVEELFQCVTPNITAGGQPTYIEFKADYLEKMFKKNI